jgi:hypothetical protein
MLGHIFGYRFLASFPLSATMIQAASCHSGARSRQKHSPQLARSTGDIHLTSLERKHWSPYIGSEDVIPSYLGCLTTWKYQLYPVPPIYTETLWICMHTPQHRKGVTISLAVVHGVLLFVRSPSTATTLLRGRIATPTQCNEPPHIVLRSLGVPHGQIRSDYRV